MADTPLVAGIDCSTQATKVVVRDARNGQPVREGRASHPDGTETDPRIWWQALREACSGGLLDGVSAIGVGAQQHGMVLLDGDGAVVRPALLWNDTRSAKAADDLIRELGGPAAWADAVGLVPVASFTVTKLRWVAENEPEHADRAARVLLPHDWLTWRLAGGGGPGDEPLAAAGGSGRTSSITAGARPASDRNGTADNGTARNGTARTGTARTGTARTGSARTGTAAEPVTDRGDASGTGYWDARTGVYRRDLLAAAFGRTLEVPRVAKPAEAVGHTPEGIVLSAGTGDNMGAALGLGAQPGDVVVSVGTSGTAYAVSEKPVVDPSGTVASFADATGRFLPLVATLNAARVLDAAAELLGTGPEELDRLALSARPGAGGLTLLPYLDGERTPNLPDARGSLFGLTRENLTRADLARAFVDGMLCGLADAVDALTDEGIRVERVILIGGGAQSAAVRAAAPVLLGRPVIVPAPAEYVAIGAARQAAWALAGTPEPPAWETGPAEVFEGQPVPAVRQAYAAARRMLYG
jgi:xylulokinase